MNRLHEIDQECPQCGGISWIPARQGEFQWICCSNCWLEGEHIRVKPRDTGETIRSHVRALRARYYAQENAGR